MKEITILSGKGGTGKTSITAALASVAQRAVFCDTDVDAADLHLVFHPEVQRSEVFLSAWEAHIDQDLCSECGLCMKKCRFDAIHKDEQGKLQVNAFQCEGCKLCEKLCPTQAISTTQSDKNSWFVSNTRFGTLVHAHMGPGEENSGKLVTKVRQEGMKKAIEEGQHYVINDGPPGIGCAVISSLTGINQVLLVIEATKSGWHDAERLAQLAKNFGIDVCAIINKYDINKEVTQDIENALQEYHIPLLSKLPFDKTMVEAMVAGKTIVEYAPESYISQQLKEIWSYLK